MRHLNAGNKLGVSNPQRKALLRGLTLALLEHDSIHTTRARAKEMRWWAERSVTLAKRGDVSARRQIIKLLGSTETFTPGENRVRNAITRLYSQIVPRFKDRSGGYTQIIRLPRPRAGDCAEMCIMRYIPSQEDQKKVIKTKKDSNKLGGKKLDANNKKVEPTDQASKDIKPSEKRSAKSTEESQEKHAEKKNVKLPEDKPASKKKNKSTKE